MVFFLSQSISSAEQADLFINKGAIDRRFVMRTAIMAFTATDGGTSIWGKMILFWSNFYKSYPDNSVWRDTREQPASIPLLLGRLPCSPSAILCITNVNNSEAPTNPLTFVLGKHCYMLSNWQWFHVTWQKRKTLSDSSKVGVVKWKLSHLFSSVILKTIYINIILLSPPAKYSELSASARVLRFPSPGRWACDDLLLTQERLARNLVPNDTVH